MDPYRASEARRAPTPRRQGSSVRELLVPFAIMWVVSLVRIIAALWSGRLFGAIDTLAAASLLLLPWALARGRVRMR